MKITRQRLNDAVEHNILNANQVDDLYNFLASQTIEEPKFDFTHVLYYLGGLIAIGAMTLFMNLGWESFGGWGIVLISIIYAGIGLLLTNLFKGKGYAIPAGICSTFVVALTPLTIYGLQQALGIWPVDSTYREYHRYIEWNWLYMELGTLFVGIIIAWKYKYPFLVMPMAVTLWYMSMDLVPLIAIEGSEWELRSMVSMYFGIVMILIAFWVDLRTSKTSDYAFWLYIFGVLTFWGGMTAQQSDNELSKFIYFCINLLMLGIGVLLVRRVFVIFGAIGGSIYLGHLASSVFEDSWLFPITLTAIGLLIIYLGVLWQKNEKALTDRLRGFLPIKMKELLDSKV